jgi:FtsP/CotA-like multicopper oxidase with cupredoxin domain
MTSSMSLRSIRRLVGWVLLWTGVFALLVVVGLTGVAAWLWSQAQQTNAGRAELCQPAQHPATAGTADRRRWVQGVRPAAARASRCPASRPRPGGKRDLPGPDATAANGDRVAINVINELPVPTSIHWHGMHLPPRSRRRSTPDDQARRHMVTWLDHRSARRQPVVSPSPAWPHS